MPMQDNSKILKSFYEAMSAHDIDRALSYFTPNAEFKMVAFDKTARGTSELKELFKSWFTAFPDMRLESSTLKGSENWAFAELFVDGTHKGIFRTPDGEIKPTNAHVRAPSCDVATLQNGKISAISCYLESGTMLRQLGLKPMRAAA